VKKTLKILGSRPEGETDALVSTQLIRPDAPPVAVDWRVRQRGSQDKVIDVAVEGVSMSVTQRQEFASVIQRGGGQIEALLQGVHPAPLRKYTLTTPFSDRFRSVSGLLGP
jgi:phospholipid transport system substrate-binding protein